jgi:hypothetical protein
MFVCVYVYIHVTYGVCRYLQVGGAHEEAHPWTGELLYVAEDLLYRSWNDASCLDAPCVLLFVVCYVLCVVCCLLFVVCCVLCVVCYVLCVMCCMLCVMFCVLCVVCVLPFAPLLPPLLKPSMVNVLPVPVCVYNSVYNSV